MKKRLKDKGKFDDRYNVIDNKGNRKKLIVYFEDDVKQAVLEILKTSTFKGNAYLIKKSDWDKIIGDWEK